MAIAPHEMTLRYLERDRPGESEFDAKEKVVERVERLSCFEYKENMTQAYTEGDMAGTLLVWITNPAK
ncbi:hypothetical protein NDU88_007871 [Pleurodeles waltl]|uniref:Uncharacterized protein n=1 Tax=Pleurodeles waltl TaxID=8319 RepID=A0AAV7VVM2_PLEWA|nr:hypothetical protein NDU88_007871 [Pleurodeles waltl]